MRTNPPSRLPSRLGSALDRDRLAPLGGGQANAVATWTMAFPVPIRAATRHRTAQIFCRRAMNSFIL